MSSFLTVYEVETNDYFHYAFMAIFLTDLCIVCFVKFKKKVSHDVTIIPS